MSAALSTPRASQGASLEEMFARFGARLARGVEGVEKDARRLPDALVLGWPELDAALPDGGLPRGVVELASPHALGGSTSVALAAVRAAQKKDARAWCAWIDPDGTLYAPGVAMAGVDLSRLLFVRPPRAEFGRIAVKVAAARACDVIVIDVDAVPGASGVASGVASAKNARSPRKRKSWPMDVLVRKLALLAEEGGSSILLLTDSLAPRAVPWPVAMRIELARAPACLTLRVAKDRRGRIALVKTRVPLSSRPRRVEVGG